ncbi:MAG: hypothetical protein KDI23_12320, partial [Pseudomonadales bacterium]|nr:hypothetical protein [Pseudomonadales bacterium]
MEGFSVCMLPSRDVGAQDVDQLVGASGVLGVAGDGPEPRVVCGFRLASFAFVAVMTDANDERIAMLTEPAFTETELALRWSVSMKTLQSGVARDAARRASNSPKPFATWWLKLSATSRLTAKAMGTRRGDRRSPV